MATKRELETQRANLEAQIETHTAHVQTLKETGQRHVETIRQMLTKRRVLDERLLAIIPKAWRDDKTLPAMEQELFAEIELLVEQHAEDLRQLTLIEEALR